MEVLCQCILHRSLYTSEMLGLLNIIWGIDKSVIEFGDSNIVEVLFHGRKSLDITSTSNN